MARTDFRFLHRLRVRWSEVDRQAVVFNARYLNYVEVATQEYFHHLGFSIYAVAAQKIFDIVTAQVTAQFEAPARVDDLLDVGIKIGDFGNRSFSVYSEVFQSLASEPITIIRARNVTIDPHTTRPMPVPQEFREAVEKFESMGQPVALEQFPMLLSARSHRAPPSEKNPPGGNRMEKRHFTPEDINIRFPNTLPPSVISHAVRCSGDRTAVYVSGQVSTDENGDVVAPGDLEAQIHQVFRNLEKVLRSAGATLKDVVSLNAYMTDINQVGVFRRIRTQYLSNDPPAITTVGVTGLAGPGLLFELAATAEIDSRDPQPESRTASPAERPDMPGLAAGGAPASGGASAAESEKVLAVLRALRELERSENPAIRSGCNAAAQRVWRVAFELGLQVEDQ